MSTPENENGAGPAKNSAPNIDRSLQAHASSAHSRINIPLNLDNWKKLPEEVSAELLWFHQYLLTNEIGWKEAEAALGYKNSAIFLALKGEYKGSYDNIVAAIRSYRTLLEKRGGIQQNEFVENAVSRLVWAGLDYALANGSITLIVGESRSGKTLSTDVWCERNNHGRSVKITAPVIGGTKALAQRIAKRVGVNRNQSVGSMIDSIYRAFNPNRILVVDEAHRLLPNDTRVVNPANLELLRDIHDETGCALALISTQRLTAGLKKGAYQYEQLMGRIGMPVLIPTKIKRDDIAPILQQFVEKPSDDFVERMLRIANSPGRLGIMVETLKAASRIASKRKERLTEDHVRKAIAFRAKMSGEKFEGEGV